MPSECVFVCIWALSIQYNLEMTFFSFYIVQKRFTNANLVPVKLRILNMRVQNGDIVYPFNGFGSFIHLNRRECKVIAKIIFS